MQKILPFLLGISLVMSACNLEKDIDVNLPSYESEIVVESYIEAGQPLRALLTESLSYTQLPTRDPLDVNTLITITAGGQTLPPQTLAALYILAAGDEAELAQLEGLVSFVEQLGLAKGATVSIKHNGTAYELEEGIYFDADNFKIYNYGNPYIVPANYGDNFSIEVNASNDRNVFAAATLFSPVPIDSTEYTFNADTLASIITWFTDDAAVDNYYRFTYQQLNVEVEPEEGEEEDGNVSESFAVNDRFFNGDDVPFGTAYDFEIGDTIRIALYHIEESYHDFLETFDEAAQANGNPFAQPASILTNVEGGLGIFATISYDKTVLIIE